MSDLPDRPRDQLRAEQRLAAVYDACAPRLLGYCTRHVGRDEADDVLAETFAIAWRRLEKVPEDAPLPWLITAARNVIRNRRRSAARRDVVLSHLRAVSVMDRPGPDAEVAERDEMLGALAGLSAKEREALLLTAWDGLDPRAAATAAGCSERAFRARVTRARRHLDAATRAPSRTAVRTSTEPAEARALPTGDLR